MQSKIAQSNSGLQPTSMQTTSPLLRRQSSPLLYLRLINVLEESELLLLEELSEEELLLLLDEEPESEPLLDDELLDELLLDDEVDELLDLR